MTVRRQRLGMVLGFLVLVCLLISYRMHRPAEWLVSPPLQIGVWEAVETPLSSDVKEQLGDPKGISLEYRNPLDERLICQLIAPRSFEAYREPSPLNLMTLTAQRQILLFGPARPVRAWVLKNKANGLRVLVYSWLQDHEGNTRIFGASGVNQGNLDRFALGGQRLLEFDSPCLIRLVALIPSTDTHGVQTRRNVEEVARGIYVASTRRGEGL